MGTSGRLTRRRQNKSRQRCIRDKLRRTCHRFSRKIQAGGVPDLLSAAAFRRPDTPPARSRNSDRGAEPGPRRLGPDIPPRHPTSSHLDATPRGATRRAGRCGCGCGRGCGCGCTTDTSATERGVGDHLPALLRRRCPDRADTADRQRRSEPIRQGSRGRRIARGNGNGNGHRNRRLEPAARPGS